MRLPCPSNYRYHYCEALAIVAFSFSVTICGASTSFALEPSYTHLSSHNQTSALFVLSSTEPGPPLVNLGDQQTPIGQQNLSTLSGPPEGKNFVFYENPRYEFSIQYPSGWQVKEGQASGRNAFVQFSSPMESESDTFLDNFNVGVQNYSGAVSLDEYGQSVVNLLESQPPGLDFRLTQQPTSAMFGSLPAQKIEYTTALQNESAPAFRTNLHGMQVWTIHDDSVFVFSFIAEQNKFALYQPVIEQILRTFRTSAT